MNNGRKIDLALEAREFASGSSGKISRLSGVTAEEDFLFGLPFTRVTVLNEAGEQAIGKPPGVYLTLELPEVPRDRDAILQTARAVSGMLQQLPCLPETGLVLVAGLGNRNITPDAIGPKTADGILVTRHLIQSMPEEFSTFRPVVGISPGVTGTTGMESGELIQAVVKKLKPACLIAVDALAARRQERVCHTIQASDTGIVPGSGVGNARMALNRETLGIPVIAVGIPTVVDAGTLCLDLLEEAGRTDFDPAIFRREGEEWFVTPRNIDHQVDVLSRVLSLGISSTLHVDISVEKVDKWTS